MCKIPEAERNEEAWGAGVTGLEPGRNWNTHSLGVKVTIFNLTLRYQNTTEVFSAEKTGRETSTRHIF